MDLFQTVDFLGKMEMLKVGPIHLCDSGLKIALTDDLGTETNICTERHPMSGTMCVPFVVSHGILSNIMT